MIKNNDKEQLNLQNDLSNAIRSGDIEAAEASIKKIEDINAIIYGSLNQRFLHEAAKSKNDNIYKELDNHQTKKCPNKQINDATDSKLVQN